MNLQKNKYYVVKSRFPKSGGNMYHDREYRYESGIYEGISTDYLEQKLFRFPHLAGKLHSGNTSTTYYPREDVWWIIESEIISELKQGGRI